ncbi:IS200/IS605 family accessory protein TnpB-related protein [Polaromonas naphthalenivorans]|uniref:Transposase, IS605 OrfB family n=1 Tax=Polaromonas naphthalenivorans (strain CJ2) TaxID=365044 RepID=A1VLV8_POLNA|nr:IS200/IS605 family accessory protein TnpB-related protein [Polaromonas naphthalenivorans]ABM36636.1 transposase, IS605 OrfB family [Polaromonas naphthalenivorans CJ2]
MSERPVFTYQTRPALDAAQAVMLDAYAELYGRAERSLFAALQAGGKLNDLKRDFLSRFGITARQFNAVRIGLEGKIDSIRQRRPELIAEAQARIKKALKVIARLTGKAPGSDKLHQKKRRLALLQSRLSAMQGDHESGKTRLCFGSKKLFHAQFELQANGYDSHEAWKKDWTAGRSSQFFVLGSKDESAGCQGCRAAVAGDGSLKLTLRLPDALSGQGKRLTLIGIRFAYGHSQIVAALCTSQHVTTKTKAGVAMVKRTGTALSYRFVRDAKGWRVFVSVHAKAVKVSTSAGMGSMGVDVNADHLAVAETDRFGNLIAARRIDLHTYGKSADQAKALIGDAVGALVMQARTNGKPVVIEKLNFQKKKAELEAVNRKQACLLSSFACNSIASGLKAAAFRAGVEVIEVNPAYTSVIGAVNHARIKGVSVHQGAALAIARRGLGLSERSAVSVGLVPTGNGGHVTFELPVRNRLKHVWSFWSKVRTNLKAAHAAHFRCGDHQKDPPPLAPATRSLGAIWSSTAQFRGANRQHNCSADVLEDVPW